MMEGVPNWPRYFVTTDGRVWGDRRQGAKGGWLYQSTNKRTGHKSVGLWRQQTRVQRKVHRLVLETFVGPCPPGMEACHNNGDPADNRLENLRWDTRRANARDMVNHGRCALAGSDARKCGAAVHTARLTEQQVRQIIYTYRTGLFTQAEIAGQYGVERSTIGYITTKRTWKHLWGAP